MMNRLRPLVRRSWALPSRRQHRGESEGSGEYTPLQNDSESRRTQTPHGQGNDAPPTADWQADFEAVPFSWLEYTIFALLGVAMLWSWNMLLAAAPYFQTRFASSPSLLASFQPVINTVFTFANFIGMSILTYRQAAAHYTLRVVLSLSILAVSFSVLALSTKAAPFVNLIPSSYLGFLIVASAACAAATSLMQNGAFALAPAFVRPEYTQAIMAGQGVAGILPPMVQLISALAVVVGRGDGEGATNREQAAADNEKEATAAEIYFLTAVGVCITCAVAFVPLAQRYNLLHQHQPQQAHGEQSDFLLTGATASDASIDAATEREALALAARSSANEAGSDSDYSNHSETLAVKHAAGHSNSHPTRLPYRPASRSSSSSSFSQTTVSLILLFRRLFWLSTAVSLCFAITLVFPVFTGKILSIDYHPPPTSSSPSPSLSPPSSFLSLPASLTPPSTFIPLAFLVWNVGDLLGRFAAAFVPTSVRHRPRLLFALSLARLVFIPLYLSCNIRGRIGEGGVVFGDWVYLSLVQFPFGLTNGLLSSLCMMAAGEGLEAAEREAAGSFMGLCLSAGLAVGSVLSFAVAGV